jgi:hypothetical protein
MQISNMKISVIFFFLLFFCFLKEGNNLEIAFLFFECINWKSFTILNQVVDIRNLSSTLAWNLISFRSTSFHNINQNISDLFELSVNNLSHNNFLKLVYIENWFNCSEQDFKFRPEFYDLVHVYTYNVLCTSSIYSTYI